MPVRPIRDLQRRVGQPYKQVQQQQQHLARSTCMHGEYWRMFLHSSLWRKWHYFNEFYSLHYSSRVPSKSLVQLLDMQWNHTNYALVSVYIMTFELEAIRRQKLPKFGATSAWLLGCDQATALKSHFRTRTNHTMAEKPDPWPAKLVCQDEMIIVQGFNRNGGFNFIGEWRLHLLLRVFIRIAVFVCKWQFSERLACCTG
jgi:hypothetical protein